MASAFLQPPAPFQPGDDPARAWEEWKSSYLIFEAACEYGSKPIATRKAFLLHCLGPQARRITQTFPLQPTGDGQSGQRDNAVDYILHEFDKLYAPYKRVTQATAIFNTMSQKPEQTIDEFVTELKLQAQKCDYGAQESRLIGDRIIIGIRDVALRERLFREPSLTLDKIISTCKAAEISKKHVNDIQKTEDEVRVDGLYRQPSSFRAAQRRHNNWASSINQSNQVCANWDRAGEAVKEKNGMLASRPEEVQGLISELVLAKAEMQRMSLEHERNIEASFGREQALQRECKAASVLLGKLQAQQAEFSHAKYQESEALKAQLVSLSGDSAKQLKLVDAKDVLLQDCGEDLPLVQNNSEQREFSAFQYLKKLLDIAKRKREALENQLAKKEEQFNLLQQNYQYLKDRYQWPLQDLGAFVRSIIEAFARSIIEHTNQSSEAAVSLEASQLEDLNRMLAVLQERVTSLTVRNELLAQETYGSSFTEKAETECERLDEKVSSLLKRNRKLKSEADVLWSKLSCLEEQAEMLVSDNKHFQQLAENLKQARHCLEEELKTQREQHVKATKEMENEHCTALDEAAKCEAALSALKTDHSQLLDKYNHIVYRHRNLQEEFHAAAQEKRSFEDRCAQLTEEWATARRALAVFEKHQGAVGQKTMQKLRELWQANQHLQERFRLLKDKHLKAEEWLVQAPNQKVEASMEHVTEVTGGTARTLEAPASRVEIEELSRRYESLLEQSRAEENKWNQDKQQQKHIEDLQAQPVLHQRSTWNSRNEFSC
ncbi:centrosomal protein of 128 kDa-like [Ixodes scapularis]|uniref:centrosomal protein of 128 kDa-like n=1 Tax=Ixodes scapularis TaxID=6945 RepID=UPI001A9F8D4C|nr:centrosomal protein of 128 kDa-like [Ixodes scapularis]